MALKLASKFTAPLIGAALFIPLSSYGSDDMQQSSMTKNHAPIADIEQVGNPITANILLGKNVKDADGRNIGEIERLFVDRTGRITHAAVAFDGHLDIGEDMVPLPWEVFDIKNNFVKNPKDSPLSLHIEKSRLMNAPHLRSPSHPIALQDISALKQADIYFADEIKQRHKEWKREFHSTSSNDSAGSDSQ